MPLSDSGGYLAASQVACEYAAAVNCPPHAPTAERAAALPRRIRCRPRASSLRTSRFDSPPFAAASTMPSGADVQPIGRFHRTDAEMGATYLVAYEPRCCISTTPRSGGGCPDQWRGGVGRQACTIQ